MLSNRILCLSTINRCFFRNLPHAFLVKDAFYRNSVLSKVRQRPSAHHRLCLQKKPPCPNRRQENGSAANRNRKASSYAAPRNHKKIWPSSSSALSFLVLPLLRRFKSLQAMHWVAFIQAAAGGETVPRISRCPVRCFQPISLHFAQIVAQHRGHKPCSPFCIPPLSIKYSIKSKIKRDKEQFNG